MPIVNLSYYFCVFQRYISFICMCFLWYLKSTIMPSCECIVRAWVVTFLGVEYQWWWWKQIFKVSEVNLYWYVDKKDFCFKKVKSRGEIMTSVSLVSKSKLSVKITWWPTCCDCTRTTMTWTRFYYKKVRDCVTFHRKPQQ